MTRNNIKQAIKEHFLSYPTAKLRVREIERLLKLPLPSVIRYCKELEGERILALITFGSVNFHTAQRTSETYLLEKRLYNLRRLYESGLIEYLRQQLSNPAIVVFGSFAKGEDTEESDIDLYIETPTTKIVSLKSFEKSLDRSIQIFQHKNIKQVNNPRLANNIVNGITLSGSIEVFK